MGKIKNTPKKQVFIIEANPNAEGMRNLCFYNRKSASNFLKFCQLYYKKIGGGNGYGAYWINDEKITAENEKICNDWYFHLANELIDSMNKHVNAVCKISAGENEAIIFSCSFPKN